MDAAHARAIRLGTLPSVGRRYFKFDDAQNARGKETLAEYQARAERDHDAEWKERMRQNRTRYQFRWAGGR